ncbi:MAG TPA: histidine phosphatase family protein [Pseudonocardiaceae bacterium]|jgi:probable phosphoglycerate mutase|nr:histidine phosphatase family protein [Pseudonocardiaceae bacterium]
MTQLLLVRHGQSTWNAEGRCQGQSATAGGLSELGMAQARTTAEELVKKLAASDLPVGDAILVSDLLRARQTAEIIAEVLDLPIQLDAGLREQYLADLEGRLYNEQFGELTVQATIDELWRDPFRRPPGGESVADMYERVQATLTRLAKANPGRVLVVATHGGVVRTARAAQPQPGTSIPNTTVDNASITPWSPS